MTSDNPSDQFSLIEPSTVRIAQKSMRISADLIPDKLRGKLLNFDAYADIERKIIVLRLPPIVRNGERKNGRPLRAKSKIVYDSSGNPHSGWELHSWYTTGRGKSPQVACVGLCKAAGFKSPKKSRIVKAIVTEEGIEIKP